MLDVDGVLVKGRPSDCRPWYSELQADLGIDPDWLRSAFFAKEWTEIVEGRADLLPRLQACLDQLATKCDAQVLIDYWFDMDSRIDQAVLEDCAELRSKGVAVYLATNQEHHRAHYLMNNMGLAAHVDGIIYSAQFGFCKPDKLFYKAAAAIVDVPPSCILLIDDTLANIIGTKQAGWNATHWTGTTSLAHAL